MLSQSQIDHFKNEGYLLVKGMFSPEEDRLFARGNGEYWFDDTGLYFHRYLTKHPIVIPFAKVSEMKIGKSHAGRRLLRSRVLKLIWEKDGMKLSSGFIVARNQQETEAVMADLQRLCS